MQSYIFFRNQTTFATILPQISISGGALVSARLCRLPEQEVHQPSKQWSLPQIARICTETLAEDVLPQISQIYTDTTLRGCTCLKCTNRARTDCLLVKFNNGFIGLNGFDGCVKIRLIRLNIPSSRNPFNPFNPLLT